MEFPIYDLKSLSDGNVYDLDDNLGRHKYFKAKLGEKIEKLKEYLDNNTFVGFLVAKKGAGKGTYSNLFREIVGEDRVVLISVGDLVRDVHKKLEEDKNYRHQLTDQLKTIYRGPISIEKSIDALLNRLEVTDKVAVPTEFVLALLKNEILKEENKNKAMFIDGFPRISDQVSYSLYFRDIMNLRDDPDFFVLFDVPENIIDARIKARVICENCKASRNFHGLPTKFIEYDKENSKFVMFCDNDTCSGFKTKKLVQKESDEHGIAHIKSRLDTDGELIKTIDQMHGIKKVLVRNSLPTSKASEYTENYELTDVYKFELNSDGSVKSSKEIWTVNDDNNTPSHSLKAAAGVVSMFNQIYDLLITEG